MAIILSFIAVLFSAFVFAYNRRATRRDLLLRSNDQQVLAENQYGRRVIFDMSERGTAPADLPPEDFLAANHALAALNILGFLYCRRYVSRRDCIALWGQTTARVVTAAEASSFLALRDSQQNGVRVWPYLRTFAADVDRKNKAL
jgi:hypothetical protein